MIMASIVMCYLLAVLAPSCVEMELMNVALHRPTRQIDTYDDWTSDRAVNGELELKATTTSCTATDSVSDTWWVVDMLHDYDVKFIQIQNRILHSDRLANFFIYVARQNPIQALIDVIPPADALCKHQLPALPNYHLQNLTCLIAQSGRYAFVYKQENSRLSLCEFEVWAGVGVDETFSDIIHRGMKSSLTPMHSALMTSPARQRCCLICLLECGSEATHFQVNKVSGMCECIQHCDLDLQDLGLVSDGGWDVWRMDPVLV